MLKHIGHAIADVILGIMLTITCITVYTLYTGNPVIIDTIYCKTHAHSELTYDVCMTVRN